MKAESAYLWFPYERMPGAKELHTYRSNPAQGRCEDMIVEPGQGLRVVGYRAAGSSEPEDFLIPLRLVSAMLMAEEN